jgi:predicted nuclease with TOPRIM domain
VFILVETPATSTGAELQWFTAFAPYAGAIATAVFAGLLAERNRAGDERQKYRQLIDDRFDQVQRENEVLEERNHELFRQNTQLQVHADRANQLAQENTQLKTENARLREYAQMLKLRSDRDRRAD